MTGFGSFHQKIRIFCVFGLSTLHVLFPLVNESLGLTFSFQVLYIPFLLLALLFSRGALLSKQVVKLIWPLYALILVAVLSYLTNFDIETVDRIFRLLVIVVLISYGLVHFDIDRDLGFYKFLFGCILYGTIASQVYSVSMGRLAYTDTVQFAAIGLTGVSSIAVTLVGVVVFYSFVFMSSGRGLNLILAMGSTLLVMRRSAILLVILIGAFSFLRQLFLSRSVRSVFGVLAFSITVALGLSYLISQTTVLSDITARVSLLADSEYVDSSRGRYWEYAWEIYSSGDVIQKTLGHGMGAFETYRVITPHNVFLDYLVTLGILGLVCWVCFFVSTIWLFIRLHLSLYRQMCLMILAVLFVFGMTSDPISSPPYFSMYFLLGGFFGVGAAQAKSPKGLVTTG